MRLRALSVGDMVGVFWEAEVRCCIAVKPSHSESYANWRAAVLIWANPEWNLAHFRQCLSYWKIVSTYSYSKGRHRTLLLIAYFDLKHLQGFGLDSTLVITAVLTFRACYENMALSQHKFCHLSALVLFLGIAFPLPVCCMTPEAMPPLGTFANTALFELNWCWDAKNVPVLNEQ